MNTEVLSNIFWVAWTASWGISITAMVIRYRQWRSSAKLKAVRRVAQAAGPGRLSA